VPKKAAPRSAAIVVRFAREVPIMPRPMRLTVTVWLLPLFVATTVFASDPTPAGSAFATPMISSDAPASALLAGVAGGGFAPPPPGEPAYVGGTSFEAVRYRPRRPRSRDRYDDRPRSRFSGASQIHAGFLDPEGPADPGFVVGFRGGQRLDDLLELGLGIDWRTKSGNETAVLQETVGPGGETIIVQRQLNRYSSNLFPVMAYLQISAPSDMGLVPYFGVAGSYQALFLSAEDFQTGEEFEATYDGWGWQLWGGAAIPLSGRTRLVGELFLNNADLHREVFDPGAGETYRETVSVDGVGGRFGFNWGF
jgi:hypothetical protein